MDEFKSFYKEVGGNEGGLCRWNARLDTYGRGCEHDCDYCYAKGLLGFRGMWHPESPATADRSKVARRIRRIKAQGHPEVVRLGGMTDCLQPREWLEGATLSAIKELNRAGVEYLIVTKSSMLMEPRYLGSMDRDLVHIQITITSTDDITALKHERASLASERIKAVELLERSGFDVAVRLSPYVPEWVEPDEFNAIECSKCVVEFLRVNGFIKRLLPDVDLSDYTVKHAGYRHLPLDKKLRLLENICYDEVTVCDDVPEHWQWFKDNFNPNPDDCCNLRRRRAGAYCVSCGWTGDRDELVPITVREDGGLKPDCKCPRCGAEGYGYKVFIEEDDDE